MWDVDSGEAVLVVAGAGVKTTFCCEPKTVVKVVYSK